MSKILLVLLTALTLTGCKDLYNFDKGATPDPRNIPHGTVGDAAEINILSGLGQTGSINQALNTITAEVKDSKGKTIAGDRVLFKVLDGTNTVITSQTITTDSNGLASFTYTPTSSGTISIQVVVLSSSNVVPPASVPLTVIGVASKLIVVSGDSQSLTAGTNLGTVTLKVEDSSGQPVPNSGVNFSTGQTSTSNSSGLITFSSNATSTTKGGHVITATLANSADSENIVYQVSANVPDSIVIVSGNNQTLTAGDTLSNLKARFVDAYGNNANGYLVTMGLSTYTTDANGEVTHSDGVKTVAGSGAVGVAFASLTSSFNYSVNPSSAASLTVISGDNQTITAGNSAGSIKVKVQDAYGNLKVGESVDFDGTTASTNSSGVATFNIGVLTTSGATPIAITLGSLSESATITVLPASPSTMEIVSGDNQSISAGSSLSSMSVRLKDAYNNLCPSQSVDFDGTTATTNSSGVASFSPGTKTSVGSGSVIATHGSLSKTFNYLVNAGSTTSLTLVSGDNQSVGRSTTTSALKVLAKDQYGNLVVGETVNFTDGSWSSNVTTDSSGEASKTYTTSSAPGSVIVTASVGSLTVSFNITVVSYVPLTANISTTDNLVNIDLSAHSASVYGSGTALTPTTASNSMPNAGYTVNATALIGTMATPTATSHTANHVAPTITSSDTLTVAVTSTYPASISGGTCKITSGSISTLAGNTCSANGNYTFPRSDLLEGTISARLTSASPGSALDFLDTSTLATKKISVNEYQVSNQFHVIGESGADKKIWFTRETGSSANNDIYSFDLDTNTIDKLTNIGFSLAVTGFSQFGFARYDGDLFIRAPRPSTSAMKTYRYDGSTYGEPWAQITGDERVQNYNVVNNILFMSPLLASSNSVFFDGTNFSKFSTTGTDFFPHFWNGTKYIGMATSSGIKLFELNGTTIRMINASAIVSKSLYASLVNGSNYYFGGDALYVYTGSAVKQLVDIRSSASDNIDNMTLYNGEIYFTSSDGSNLDWYKYNIADDKLYALQFNGTVARNSALNVPPAVVYGSALYVCSGGDLYRIASSGTTKITLDAKCSFAGTINSRYAKVINNVLYLKGMSTTTSYNLIRICDPATGCSL